MNLAHHPDAVIDEIRRRLAAIGIRDPDIKPGYADSDGTTSIRAAFTGRDPAGHGTDVEIEIRFSENDADEVVLQRIQSRLAPQVLRAERVAGAPIAMVGPNMPLGHLRVYGPFARRLRMDHGAGAAPALRTALLEYHKGGIRKLSKKPRPYGLSIDANRVDHREELGEGIFWKGRVLVLCGTVLPVQMLMGMAGQPVRRIVEHPIIDEGMTIVRAFSERATARSAGTTVIETDGEWVPGDRI